MSTIANCRKHCGCFIAGSILIVSGFPNLAMAQFGHPNSYPPTAEAEITDFKRAYERELERIEHEARHMIDDALIAARKQADEMRQRETKAAREKLLAA